MSYKARQKVNIDLLSPASYDFFTGSIWFLIPWSQICHLGTEIASETVMGQDHGGSTIPMAPQPIVWDGLTKC